MIRLLGFVIFLIPLNVFATTCISNSFLTIFSDLNDIVIGDFTLSQNGYSVIFSGGLANDMLSPGTSNWNIIPLGASLVGTSAGEATATMNPPADNISAALYAGTNTFGRVQLLDVQGSLVQEITFSNGAYVDVFWLQETGAALVSQLKVIIDGGTDISYLTTYSYSNRSLEKPCEVQTGGLNPLPMFLMGFYILITMREKRLLGNADNSTYF